MSQECTWSVAPPRAKDIENDNVIEYFVPGNTDPELAVPPQPLPAQPNDNGPPPPAPSNWIQIKDARPRVLMTKSPEAARQWHYKCAMTPKIRRRPRLTETMRAGKVA